MKRKLTRLLVILIAMAMIVPATGLAYAAPNDNADLQTEDAAVENPLEGDGPIDIDPARLHVKKLGEDLDLDAIKDKASKEIKSGKTLSLSYGGRTKAGKKANILFQVVRKSGDCIAYGPSVTVKCTLKAP